MGAWGLLFDENDDAADWLGDFGDNLNWALVDDAFDAAEADYLEAPEASNILAAAEIVAAALGKPSPRLDNAIRSWTANQLDEAVARKDTARWALEIVRDNSELSELWQESEEHADWIKSVEETLSRL